MSDCDHVIITKIVNRHDIIKDVRFKILQSDFGQAVGLKVDEFSCGWVIIFGSNGFVKRCGDITEATNLELDNLDRIVIKYA